MLPVQSHCCTVPFLSVFSLSSCNTSQNQEDPYSTCSMVNCRNKGTLQKPFLWRPRLLVLVKSNKSTVTVTMTLTLCIGYQAYQETIFLSQWLYFTWGSVVCPRRYATYKGTEKRFNIFPGSRLKLIFRIQRPCLRGFFLGDLRMQTFIWRFTSRGTPSQTKYSHRYVYFLMLINSYIYHYCIISYFIYSR